MQRTRYWAGEDKGQQLQRKVKKMNMYTVLMKPKTKREGSLVHKYYWKIIMKITLVFSRKLMCQLAQYQRVDYSLVNGPAVFSPLSYRNMDGLSRRSLHRKRLSHWECVFDSSRFHQPRAPPRGLRWGCEPLICLTPMWGCWVGEGGGRLKHESATRCGSPHNMTIPHVYQTL